jgi:type VI protein secretion system component VasF
VELGLTETGRTEVREISRAELALEKVSTAELRQSTMLVIGFLAGLTLAAWVVLWFLLAKRPENHRARDKASDEADGAGVG